MQFGSETDDESAGRAILSEVQEVTPAGLGRYSLAATLSAGRRLCRRDRAARLTGAAAAVAVAVVAVAVFHAHSPNDAEQVIAAAPPSGWQEADCPGQQEGEPFSGDLDAAARDLQQQMVSIDRAESIYTGDYSCGPSNSLLIYRIPGHTDFDRATEGIGVDHHVDIRLVDTRRGLGELKRIEVEVTSKRAELAGHGAKLRVLYPTPRDGGYVYVEVEGDAAAAQRDLSTYGDAVRVAATPPS